MAHYIVSNKRICQFDAFQNKKEFKNKSEKTKFGFEYILKKE